MEKIPARYRFLIRFHSIMCLVFWYDDQKVTRHAEEILKYIGFASIYLKD